MFDIINDIKVNFIESKNNDYIKEFANYEGNETLLFYERLKNPEIREQLINTYLYYYKTQDKPFLIFDENGNDITDKWQKTVKTREEINDEINQKIETAFSQTGIDYSKKGVSCMDDKFGFGTIFFESINPETGEKFSKKQLSITEAHEKGHFLREFVEPGQLFKSEILKGFDFSKINIDERRLKEIQSNSSFDWQIKIFKENEIEYFERPIEIFERMAQLKNYFGMKGSEKFTKQHLVYAKANYIKDTKMPEYQIKPFLDAITLENEENFLKLINSLGI